MESLWRGLREEIREWSQGHSFCVNLVNTKLVPPATFVNRVWCEKLFLAVELLLMRVWSHKAIKKGRGLKLVFFQWIHSKFKSVGFFEIQWKVIAFVFIASLNFFSGDILTEIISSNLEFIHMWPHIKCNRLVSVPSSQLPFKMQ